MGLLLFFFALGRLVLSLVMRACKSEMASRTDSGAVPPGTFLLASAASRLRVAATSASNAGQIFLSVSSGSEVQGTFCFFSASRKNPCQQCRELAGTEYLCGPGNLRLRWPTRRDWKQRPRKRSALNFEVVNAPVATESSVGNLIVRGK